MKNVLLLIGFVLASIHFAEAQQPTKIPCIGYVSGTGDAYHQGPYVEALRQGLKEHGYTEGKDIVIEYRGAEAKLDRLPHLVAQLVQLKSMCLSSSFCQPYSQQRRQQKRSRL